MDEHPAIALIEFGSIAIGARASDAIAKKSPVTIVRTGTLHPGKYAILFSGQVAAVDESYVEGCRFGADCVIDRVFLPDVAPSVYEAILGRRGDWREDTLGIIETFSMAAVIEAADAAVKGANVEVVEIRLGDGLDGKGLAHFAGVQADVEAAIEIGTSRIAHRNQPVWKTIIPRIDAELRAMYAKSTYFQEGTGRDTRNTGREGG
ncbi:MAG TPA: BMC domain-containing protein [Phycisphaerae bacterium]|nr:BMC domain-containing protein [Phycisphaerae bacterium]